MPHPSFSFYSNEGAEQGQPLPYLYCKATAFLSEANTRPQRLPSYRCLKDSSRMTDCDKTFCLEATGLSILRTAQDSGSHSQRAAQEARRQLLLPQGKLVWTLAQALPTCGVLARQYSRYTPIPSRVTPEGTPGSGQAHGELPSLFSPSRGWHPSVCLSSQQRPFSASGP